MAAASFVLCLFVLCFDPAHGVKDHDKNDDLSATSETCEEVLTLPCCNTLPIMKQYEAATSKLCQRDPCGDEAPDVQPAPEIAPKMPPQKAPETKMAPQEAPTIEPEIPRQQEPETKAEMASQQAPEIAPNMPTARPEFFDSFGALPEVLELYSDCSEVHTGAFKTVCFLKVAPEYALVTVPCKDDQQCAEKKHSLDNENQNLALIAASGVRVVRPALYRGEEVFPLNVVATAGEERKRVVSELLPLLRSPFQASVAKFCTGEGAPHKAVETFFQKRTRGHYVFRGDVKVQAMNDLIDLAIALKEKVSIMDLQIMMQESTGEVFVLDPGPTQKGGNDACSREVGRFACLEAFLDKDSFADGSKWTPAGLKYCTETLKDFNAVKGEQMEKIAANRV